MVRQGISRDVVRLNERSIQKITQRDAVARLKADVVFHDADKGLLRNRNHLIEIARFLFRPIQDHTCGRDFGQAADLKSFSGLLLLPKCSRSLNRQLHMLVRRPQSGE